MEPTLIQFILHLITVWGEAALYALLLVPVALVIFFGAGLVLAASDHRPRS